jgi:hypothetical protein
VEVSEVDLLSDQGAAQSRRDRAGSTGPGLFGAPKEPVRDRFVTSSPVEDA